MTLTGPDRDEVFQWDPSEPELMKEMILAGVQVQMPIEPLIKSDKPSSGLCNPEKKKSARSRFCERMREQAIRDPGHI